MNTLTIGDWIRFGRIAKNMTPGHLAEKMGIARTLVRAWEEGSEEPDKQLLEVMAKIYGIEPLEYLQDEQREALQEREEIGSLSAVQFDSHPYQR